MMKTGISFCSVILSVATLSTPSIALASQVPGTGVINGTFSTPQSTKNSPWIQYYPSGVVETDQTNPGIKMQDGRLYMKPRNSPWNGPCYTAADIAVFQADIVPIDDDIEDLYVELEFDLKIELAPQYICNETLYKAWSAADLIALKPTVWKKVGTSEYLKLKGQGVEFMISTQLAGTEWYHYKSTWLKSDISKETRYLISFQLGDMGESMCYEFDKYGNCADVNGDGYVAMTRPNQALLELDNVQLTSKNDCQISCTVIPPGISLDVLFDARNPIPRAILGGAFSAGGDNVACAPVNSCPADLDKDGAVNGADLAVVLSAWGSDNCIADFNNDGVVNGADLSWVLSAWGTCP